MSEVTHVGAAQFVLLSLGVVIALAAPTAVALWWKFKKKEPIATILVGAVTFLLFALILEKPIQNVLAFPTAMGLPDHALSRALAARPVLLALVAGLFPGVFEETGRLLAFRFVLKNRRNRETSISYGIGHGGFEVMILVGVAFVEYIIYGIMLNTGLFDMLVEKVAAQAPDQLGSVETLVGTIAGFSAADLGMTLVERVIAVLFHVGASILVFYACKERKKFWLYPLAVALHTALDFVAGLWLFGVIALNAWAFEGIFAACGALTFLGAYFALYKRDVAPAASTDGEETESV